MAESLSLAQARRIALAAQGFGEARLGAQGRRVDRRHAHRVLERVHVVQIDSINVAVRSQEMPLFARLGPHPRDLWPRLAAAGEVFEAWCHEASLLPVEAWPLLAWRRHHDGPMWGGTRAVAEERPAYVAAVLGEVRDRGPLRAGDLSEPGTRPAGMWGRSEGKKALEYLFATGQVAAWRDPGTFTRWYDLVERVLPADVLAAPAPAEADAQRALLDRAGRALGIATERDLADYHRLNLPRARPLIAELVEDGRLVPVAVRGWDRPTYLHAEARRPHRLRARALLTPFDSLVWERARAEELFGFRYRIEIYVRPEQRVHGYYVLPFLLGDRLVARVDLKSDRPTSTLRVKAAYGEPGSDAGPVAEALAAELHLMAGWLGLERVGVEPRGDLAGALAAEVPGARAGGGA
ncbi:MAG TPA: crosslink repair DNA glycosylase YcaQ family protein [Acidimicrobiales bacterium]|nr:crosslink repair DNA glycosylase YcaQ family protein [Acidimicrobiales bacterium]